MTRLDQWHASENISLIITTVVSICFGLTHLHIFPASHRLHVFVSSFDWFTGLSVFFVICDCFGFTTQFSDNRANLSFYNFVQRMEWQRLFFCLRLFITIFNRMPANTPQIEKSPGNRRRYVVSVDFLILISKMNMDWAKWFEEINIDKRHGRQNDEKKIGY